jgi:hypothetical protein
LCFLTQNKDKFWTNLIITLVFKKNTFFGRKLGKIAENCDHNIDPWFAPALHFLLNRRWTQKKSCRPINHQILGLLVKKQNFTPPGPRGEICPLGGMFYPSFTTWGEHFLLLRRMEGGTENFTPRG